MKIKQSDKKLKDMLKKFFEDVRYTITTVILYCDG